MSETLTITKTIAIVDADGKPIHKGSVLREINDGDRGVVTQILMVGDRGPMFCSAGDLVISKRPGISRVTNRYSQWRHIPHNEQTYDERFASWLCRPYFHDEHRGIPKGEGLAIEGIMSLLPDDIVDWEYGPTPDRLEDALRFLTTHLESRRAHLDLLREAEAQIVYLHEKFQETGSGNAVLAKIRAITDV